MLAWPSSSCTARRSPLDCSRCDANECRSMCGCTCVGSPACSAWRFSRERTWLAVSRVPRLLTNSAGSPACASCAAQRQPLRERGQRCAADRHAAPLRALAEHVHGGVGGIDPAGCAVRWPGSRARPVRRRAGRSRTAARRCSGRARRAPALPSSSRCSASADRVVDRQGLRQRLRRLRRAHAVDRVQRDQAVAAEPAVEAAPGREHQRDAARREPAAMQLRGPAADLRGRAPRAARRRRWRPSDCSRSSASRYSASVRAARRRSTWRCTR